MKVTQNNPVYGNISSKNLCTVYQKIGDIDGNNNVNSIDLGFLRKFLLGQVTLTNLQRISADINKDGNVNAIDYAQLYNCLSKGAVYNTIGSLQFIIYGDVNNDGNVDFSDYDLVNNYLSDGATLSAVQMVATDVDGNGTVDSGDCDYIKSYIVSDNVIFPAVN
jgi:hypothetical protein